METKQVFLRNASGLVRTAGPWDLFAFNFGLISVGIALTLLHANVPSNYAGASIPLAEVFAAVLMAAIAFGFWAWTVTIPRSGGLYAFISRGLSPIAGFTLSFVDSITWLFYNAIAVSYVTTIGLAPSLFVFGFLTHSADWCRLAILLAQPLPQFITGVAIVAASTIVVVAGMRPFFRAQAVAILLALFGTAIAVVVLWMAAPSSVAVPFVHAFGPYAPGVGRALAAQPPTQPLSWSQSARALVWPLLSFVGSIFSVNIGGEVRQARRSQAFGIFGSILVALVILVLLSSLGDKAFGNGFQAALGALPNATPPLNLPIPPDFSLLASLATNQPWEAAAICIGFMAWAFLWIPATIVYCARAVLAWSFDRVAPGWLGYVHPKFHTPSAALLVVAAANIGLLALYIFTPFFNTLVPVLAAMIAWVPVMLAAIIFPFWRKELYASTPLASHRILGLPFLSFAGVVGLIATLAICWMLWNDPIAAGHDPATLAVIGTVFATGAVWYLAAKAVRRRQGITLEHAYREIPPE